MMKKDATPPLFPLSFHSLRAAIVEVVARPAVLVTPSTRTISSWIRTRATTFHPPLRQRLRWPHQFNHPMKLVWPRRGKPGRVEKCNRNSKSKSSLIVPFGPSEQGEISVRRICQGRTHSAHNTRPQKLIGSSSKNQSIGIFLFRFVLKERVSFALEHDCLRFVFELYLEIHIIVLLS